MYGYVYIYIYIYIYDVRLLVPMNQRVLNNQSNERNIYIFICKYIYIYIYVHMYIHMYQNGKEIKPAYQLLRDSCEPAL